MNTILNTTRRLKALFIDMYGEGIELDSVEVQITKPDTALNVFDVEVVDQGEGFYTLDYNDVDILGEYLVTWTGVKDGQVILREEKFDVVEGYRSVSVLPKIEENQLITILLSGILSVDGDPLVEDTFGFVSEYNPYYCSVDMVRMQLGTFANDVEDDLIGLCIHLASVDAKNSTGTNKNLTDNENYQNALSRLVMFDACIRLLTMPITLSDGSGDQKQLGDLMIVSGGSKIELKDILKELQMERSEWWRIVNAGGSIVAGQGLGPSFAKKGSRNANTANVGRVWHDPWNEAFYQPTVNSKYRKPGETKERPGFTGYLGWSPWRQG